MSLTEFMAIASGLVTILGLLASALQGFWSRERIKTGAQMDTAEAKKTRAEAADILVDTTMEMMKRLQDEVSESAASLDEARRARDEAAKSKEDVRAQMQERITYFQNQLAECQNTSRTTTAKLEQVERLWQEDRDRQAAAQAQMRKELADMLSQFVECKSKLDTLIASQIE